MGEGEREDRVDMAGRLEVDRLRLRLRLRGKSCEGEGRVGMVGAGSVVARVAACARCDE